MNKTSILDEARVDMIDLSDTGSAIAATRHAAAQAGFNETDQCLIATAASELATNIIRYAGRGVVIVRVITAGGQDGVEVEARDAGPGIPDIALAMQENYSTGNSLGMGLPGVKRIMDEFSIESAPGHGTRCVARKWRN
ncbi:MAG: anti-sigma regulatory factor [Desulfovibrionaceae bacterium]